MGRLISIKHLLFAGVATAALGNALPAAAQSTVSPQGAAQAPGSQSDKEVDAQSDPNDADIVVTANKRAENVQSVGVSVSVVSGAKLREQKLERLSDYVAFLPGVTANSTGTPGQTSLTIRGISPLSAGSKVATYIDETPLGSSGIWAQAGGLTLDLLPFDLDRLEVLRGPQGTLYGASSMGGLVKYVLTTPSTTKFSVNAASDIAAVSGAHRPEGTLQGQVNIPIVSDVLGISASGFYKYTPGYIDNAYTGKNDTNANKQYGGRFAVFLQPAPHLSVKLNALLQVNDSDDNAVESVLAPTVTSATATSPKVISGGTAVGRRTESNAFAATFHNVVNFYSGTVDWDLGPVDVVSATSWSKYDVSRLANRSQSLGTYLPLLKLPEGLVLGSTSLGTKKFTQELRLASPQGRFFSFQIGGFYTSEDQSNLQLQDAFTKSYLPIAPLQPDVSYITIPTTYREYAAFGDVTVTLTPKFDVSGGVRYSHNKQVFDLSARGALAGLPQTPLVSLNTIRSSESNTTWSAGARYRPATDVLLFFRAATGYAPGGANSPIPGVPQAVVESETLTSYEVGLKSQFLNRRGLLNVSLFRIDWNNIQLGATANGIGYTANGGSARSQGAEASASFSPLHRLIFSVNAAYTDARLTSLNPRVTTAFLINQKLQNVPDWAVSGNFEYGFDISEGWSGKFGGSVRWVDNELGSQPASRAPLFTLPAYAIGDLTASVTNGRYSFGVYARNVTDSRAYSGGYPYVSVTGGIRQIDYYIAQPRTIGASASVSF